MPDDPRTVMFRLSSSPTSGEIRVTVTRMEALAIWAPRLVFLLLWVLLLMVGLRGWGIADAVLVAIVMGFLARLCARLLEVLVLQPYRVVRYRRMAAQLAIQVGVLAVPCSLLESWWANAPGALAIASDGYAVLIDRSSDYEALRLHPANIVGVSVEWDATCVARTRQGGRFGLGFGGFYFGAVMFGGRSRFTTRRLEAAAVELRYQTMRHGEVRTAVIPFETDRLGAEALRDVLSGLPADHASVG